MNGNTTVQYKDQNSMYRASCSINLDEFYSRSIESDLDHHMVDEQPQQQQHVSKSLPAFRNNAMNKIISNMKNGSSERNHHDEFECIQVDLNHEAKKGSTENEVDHINNDTDVQIKDGIDHYHGGTNDMIQKRHKNTRASKEVEIIELLSSPESSLTKIQIDDSSPNNHNDIISKAKMIENSKNDCNLISARNNEVTTDHEIQLNQKKLITVYFLHRGRTMSKSRIEVLQNALFQKVESHELSMDEKIQLDIIKAFNKKEDVIPNYVVVDGYLTIEQVSNCLGFSTVQEMATFLKMVSNCR